MMMNTPPGDPASARLLSTYARQYGLSGTSPNHDRQVGMLVDDTYRIQLDALPCGGIAMRSRLRRLPAPGPARNEFLLAVARMACGMMQESAAGCVIDEAARSLWLQQATPADTVEKLDEALGDFVNHLAFWAKTTASL